MTSRKFFTDALVVVFAIASTSALLAAIYTSVIRRKKEPPFTVEVHDGCQYIVFKNGQPTHKGNCILCSERVDRKVASIWTMAPPPASLPVLPDFESPEPVLRTTKKKARR